MRNNHDIEIQFVTLDTITDKIQELVEYFKYLSIKDLGSALYIFEKEFTKIFEEMELSFDMMESRKSSFRDLIQKISQE